jgi:signal transduction histidine kinase
MPPEFAEGLGHEINNPLTGILGNAEMGWPTANACPPPPRNGSIAVRLREMIRRLSVTREIQVPDAIRSA